MHSQSLLSGMHFLQQGHSIKTSPNTTNNWVPNIQTTTRMNILHGKANRTNPETAVKKVSLLLSHCVQSQRPSVTPECPLPPHDS